MTDKDPQKPNPPFALQQELFLGLCTVGLFLMGVAYALKLTGDLAGPALANIVYYPEHILSGAAVLLILFGMARLFTARRRAHDSTTEDSFIGAMFKEAGYRTFTYLFVGIVLMRALVKFDMMPLDRDQILDALMAFTMLFYAACFWFLIRDTREDADEMGGGA